MQIIHSKTLTQADGGNTDIVVPSDWNSQHKFYLDIGGNTLGTSNSLGGINGIVFQGGNNVTLSGSQGTDGSGATVVIQAGGGGGGVAYSAANGSTSSGTLKLVNTNGVSWSTSTDGLRASVLHGFSASGGSSSFNNIMTFSNSANGVTFSNSNGQLVMSHSLQQLSNTTAITSNAVHTSNSSLFELTANQSDYLQMGNSSAAYAGTNATISIYSNGVSISAGGGGVVNQTGPNFAAQNGVTVTSGTVVFANSNGVSFGLAAGAGGGTITASAAAGGGGAAITYLTYQNCQLGASSSTQFTNGQYWMVPFRVAGGNVSASTIQYIQSISGSFTSAVAATHGETANWIIYSQNATNLSQFDSMSSGSFTWQVWNSGTSSASWAINGTTSSSAGTGVLTQAAGVRMMQIPYGAQITQGLYVLGLAVSTSTAGYASLISRYGVVLDAPMPLSMGNNFGVAPATTIGYVDAGTFSTTSASPPVSVNFSQIRQHSNLVPYFKVGAI